MVACVCEFLVFWSLREVPCFILFSLGGIFGVVNAQNDQQMGNNENEKQQWWTRNGLRCQ